MNSDAKLLFMETFLLGDLIYLGPLLSVVRKQLPDAQIEVLASNATRDFPFFEQLNVKVHYFDFPWSHIGWQKQPVHLVRAGVYLTRKFGQRFCDYVMFDPRGDVRHTLVAHLLKPKRFIQYHSGTKWRDSWRGVLPRHTFICHQEFLHRIAAECDLLPDVALPWPWLKHFKADDQEKHTRRVLIAPEASNMLRYWKSDRWKQLSKILRLNGWRVTLVSHRHDAITQIALDDFDDIWRGSLSELAQLIGISHAVIAVDSFVGHLAAAIGTPVVSLFGPQAPERWCPWGQETSIVIVDGFPCRPCGQKICVCPYNSCMDAIQVDRAMCTFKGLMVNKA